MLLETSERCTQDKRKTINGDDIIYALKGVNFENFVEPLKLYLHKYREYEKLPGTKKAKKYSAGSQIESLTYVPPSSALTTKPSEESGE